MGPAVVEELRGTFPHMGVTLYGGLGLPGKDRIPIAEAMATHDILVTACGRTVYEAARVGIPTISIPVNAREATHVRLPSVHYLDRAEMALGQVAGAVEALYRAPRLRREMSETGRALVDGRGAQRIARMIDNLSEGLL
jgi:spore coat polysaccharide biosynthesis predicted glycosyltransferase SpsG